MYMCGRDGEMGPKGGKTFLLFDEKRTYPFGYSGTRLSSPCARERKDTEVKKEENQVDVEVRECIKNHNPSSTPVVSGVPLRT